MHSTLHDNSVDVALAAQVVKVRYWQHIVNERMKRGAIKMAVHTAFGYEAIAVAVSNAMGPSDQLVLTHRNIAHNLARVGAIEPALDEYVMAPTGLGHGRLGSMNMSNPDRGIVYVSSILGNNLSVAGGLALGQKVMKKDGVVIVTTGDGAMEEGTFAETLVLAKSLDLRLLVIVENNDFAMASTIAERRRPIALSIVCEGYGVRYEALSGNHVGVYADALKRLRSDIVERNEPVCLEVSLAMMNRHAGTTPGWPTDPMKVDLNNGLIVHEDDTDPLYVIRSLLDPGVYRDIEEKVLAQDRRFLA
jgi:TPP-dependent pyruvate/acetoin dehydrogenase alpha subunit